VLGSRGGKGFGKLFDRADQGDLLLVDSDARRRFVEHARDRELQLALDCAIDRDLSCGPGGLERLIAVS
jgi:hypothetical protein